MVSLVHWRISLRERQERVGGGDGRNGESYWASSGRESGGLWWIESGERIYGTEMGNRQPEKRDKVVNEI